MDRPIVVPRRNLVSPTPTIRDPLWAPKPKPRVMTLNNSHELNQIISSSPFSSPVAKPRRSLKRKQEEDVGINTTPSSFLIDDNFRSSWAQQIQQLSTSVLFQGQVDQLEGGGGGQHLSSTAASRSRNEILKELDYVEVGSEVLSQYPPQYEHLKVTSQGPNGCNLDARKNVYSKYPQTFQIHPDRKGSQGIKTKRRRTYDDSLPTNFSCNIL